MEEGSVFQVVCIGTQGVGKTTFISQSYGKEYDSEKQLVSSEYMTKEIVYNNTVYNVAIFEMADEAIALLKAGDYQRRRDLKERATILTFGYCHAIIIMFSYNSRPSFDALIDIHKEVKYTQKVKKKAVVLVGTRLDRQQPNLEVTTEEAEKLAKKWKIPYLEISAELESLDEVFETVLSLYEQIEERKNRKRCTIL